MRKPYLCILLLFANIFLAQELSFAQSQKLHPYIPGDVIIKFNETAALKIEKKEGKKINAFQSSDSELNEILSHYELRTVEKVFPEFKLPKKRYVRFQNGYPLFLPDLGKVHIIKLKKEHRTQELIRELKTVKSIEYAEPNYIYSINGFENPNDEKYPEQWGIKACKIDKLWANHAGTSNQIIDEDKFEITHTLLPTPTKE